MVLTGRQQLSVGHGQIDAHPAAEIALVMMAMRGLHNDPATHDLIVELIELRCFLMNTCLHGSRGLHVTECNLQGYLLLRCPP